MALAALKFSRSAAWVALEAVGGSAFSSIGMVVIASIIGPRSLGLCAITLGIVQTVNFFPDTLFHDAIIQRRRLSASHLGGAFWSVCGVSVILGLSIAGSAHWIASLYREPDLTPLLLVLSATTVPTAVASIQTARLRRAMKFRRLATYIITSRATATTIGLGMAIGGFGPWAIVAQYGLSTTVLAAILVINCRWRFVRHFAVRQAREISVFAFTRTISHFVDMCRSPFFFALMGHYLSLQILGEVNLAFRLVESTTTVISTTLLRLYLPVLSRIQGNIKAIADEVWRASSTTAALLVPLFAVLALTGNDFVHVLASKNWQQMDGLIPWFCLSGIAVVVGTPSNTAMLAVGRPILVSFASAAVLAALTGGILVVQPTSGEAAVVCWTLPVLAGLLINIIVSRWTIGFGLRAQASSRILPAIVTSFVVATSFLAQHLLDGQTPMVRLAGELGGAGIAYLMCIATMMASSRVQAPRIIGRRRVLARFYRGT